VQGRLQAPQWALLIDVSTHAADAPEPHTICPIGHRHMLDWHV
jgi:hypothetical protein